MRAIIGAIALVVALHPVSSAAPQTAPATAPPAVIGSIAGPDGPWDYAAIDDAARRLYVARGDGVMAIDLESGKITPRLVTGRRVHAVVPLMRGRALSTNGEANTATLFDTASGKVIAEVPTGKSPDAAVLDPASGLVLVMDHAAGDVTLVDPRTGTSPGRIPVGGTLEFAAADGQGHVFVNIEDKSEIAVIDTAARNVTAHYALPGCARPTGLAIDPATGLLVAACANETAVALRSDTGRVVATLAIGRRPDAVLFDPARKLFYVPCGGDGTMSVIAERDDAAPSVIANIATAMGARTGAVDPRTERVYLPTADPQPGAAGQRPGHVPGTFHIVIVGPKL